METVSGTVEVRRMNVGSKSEGDYAWLVADDRRELRLYRADVFPAGDAFLRSLAGTRVFADGETETGGYFRVEAVRLADGTPRPFPPQTPPDLPPDFDLASLSRVLGARKSPRPRFPKKSKRRRARR